MCREFDETVAGDSATKSRMMHLRVIAIGLLVACQSPAGRPVYVSQEERAARGQPTATPDGSLALPAGETGAPSNSGQTSQPLSRLALRPGGRLSLFTYEWVKLQVVYQDDQGQERDVTSEATFTVRNPRAGSVSNGHFIASELGSQSTTVTATFAGETSDPMLVSTFASSYYEGFDSALTVEGSGVSVARSSDSPINGSHSLRVSFDGAAGQKMSIRFKPRTALSFVNVERMQIAYRTSRALKARCGTLNGAALAAGLSDNTVELRNSGRPSFTMSGARADDAFDVRYITCELELVESGPGTLVLDDVAALSQFIVGANLAWLDGQYQHDFGRSYHHPEWSVAYNPTHVEKILHSANDLGIRLLRVWVFESCEGLEKDSAQYVTGVGPELWAHFDDFIFRQLPKYDIKVYLTMVGGHHFNECSSPSPFDDAQARDALYDHAILPFVARYKNSPWVWGIDLMNEPEGGIGGPTGNYFTGTTWTNARAFLAHGAEAVKGIAPGLYVSSGSGWQQHKNVQAGLFSGLGFSHLDFHAYNDEGTLPTYESLQRHARVLVGEAGQISTRHDQALQASVLSKMLNHAAGRHYWGVLPWTLDYPGAPGELSLFDPTSTYEDIRVKPALLELQRFVLGRGDIGP